MSLSKYTKLLIIMLIAVLQFGAIDGFSQMKSERMNVKTFNASSLDWKLWGYRPNSWRMNFDFNQFTGSWAEFRNIPFTMPGSVQLALKNAGIIPDWNIGVNNTACEWVENRHWIIVSKIPDSLIPKENENINLDCAGLDYRGILMINGKEVGQFNNAFVPWSFNIKPYLKATNNTIAFVFETQPENLAQIGWTSKIKDWKPRFNYGWDWIPRIVQIGIFEKVTISLFKEDQAEIQNLQILTDADKTSDKGELKIKADLNKSAILHGKMNILLSDQDGKTVFAEQLPAKELLQQKIWKDLKIKR